MAIMTAQLETYHHNTWVDTCTTSCYSPQFDDTEPLPTDYLGSLVTPAFDDEFFTKSSSVKSVEDTRVQDENNRCYGDNFICLALSDSCLSTLKRVLDFFAIDEVRNTDGINITLQPESALIAVSSEKFSDLRGSNDGQPAWTGILNVANALIQVCCDSSEYEIIQQPLIKQPPENYVTVEMQLLLDEPIQTDKKSKHKDSTANDEEFRKRIFFELPLESCFVTSRALSWAIRKHNPPITVCAAVIYPTQLQRHFYDQASKNAKDVRMKLSIAKASSYVDSTDTAAGVPFTVLTATGWNNCAGKESRFKCNDCSATIDWQELQSFSSSFKQLLQKHKPDCRRRSNPSVDVDYKICGKPLPDAGYVGETDTELLHHSKLDKTAEKNFGTVKSRRSKTYQSSSLKKKMPDEQKQTIDSDSDECAAVDVSRKGDYCESFAPKGKSKDSCAVEPDSGVVFDKVSPLWQPSRGLYDSLRSPLESSLPKNGSFGYTFALHDLESIRDKTNALSSVPVHKVDNPNPKLVFYLAPSPSSSSRDYNQLSGHSADLAVSNRRRVVPYERNLREEKELEAYNHRELFKRFASFSDPHCSWKRSKKLGYLLAQAGFYYAPESAQNQGLFDKLRCAFCKRGKYNWWPYDYPETGATHLGRPTDVQVAVAFVRWHITKSPTCPRVLDLLVDSVGLTTDEYTQVADQLQKSLVYQPASRVIALVAQPEFKVSLIDSPEIADAIEHELVCYSQSGKVVHQPDELAAVISRYEFDPLAEFTNVELNFEKNSKLPPASSVSESPYFAIVDQCLHQSRRSNVLRTDSYPLFVSESTRLATFRRRINAELAYPRVTRRNYSEGRQDEIVLSDTETQQQPRESYRLALSSSAPEERDLLERLMSTNLELGSQPWNQRISVSPEKLAAAGFFTTLNHNEVYCFSCGLSLTEDVLDTDPWLEHAFRQPDCPYLLCMRGRLFVQLANRRFRGFTHSHQLIAALHMQQIPAYTPLTGFTQPPLRLSDGRMVRARFELPLVRAIYQSGIEWLDANLMRFAILLSLRDFNYDTEINTFELVQLIRDLYSRMKEMDFHVPSEFVQTVELQLDSFEQMLEATPPPLPPTRQSQAPQRFHHPEIGQARIPTLPPANNQQSTPRTDPVENQNNASGNSESNESNHLMCKVCYSARVEVVFMDCGHLVSCFSCAERCEHCPVCRAPIKSVMRVYS